MLPVVDSFQESFFFPLYVGDETKVYGSSLRCTSDTPPLSPVIGCFVRSTLSIAVIFDTFHSSLSKGERCTNAHGVHKTNSAHYMLVLV